MGYKDPEQEKEYQRNYQIRKYHRWMAEAREKLGGKCAVCETTENLQFDHIDPATKLFTLGKRRVRREIFDAEVAKCQLLCVEHHREKTLQEQRKEIHGTWGMYKRKCRCRECRDFVNAYMREYKRMKRSRPASLVAERVPFKHPGPDRNRCGSRGRDVPEDGERAGRVHLPL